MKKIYQIIPKSKLTARWLCEGCGHFNLDVRECKNCGRLKED